MKSPYLLALFFTVGCIGSVDEMAKPRTDDPVEVPTESCAGQQVGASPLRRLTRWEYRNSVRAALGNESIPELSFAPEPKHYGFDNNADGSTFGAGVVEDYERAARKIAERFAPRAASMLGCDPDRYRGQECFATFLETIARRLFRRPLSEDETARYFEFFESHERDFGFSAAMELSLSAVLQSPHFLYRPEVGEGPDGNGVRRLTPFEVATRLSYLLTGSGPDEELLNAAEFGGLSHATDIRAQAERLLRGSTGAIENFFEQWGHLDAVSELDREHASFSGRIAELMEEESRRFVRQVMTDGDGSIASLLTEPQSMLNTELAEFYGVKGVDSDLFVPVDLDPRRASGLMTHGALMAHLAHPGEPSHVNRGVFVLERLLCAPPPPPPNDVDPTLPPFDPKATTREQLEQKTSSGTCKGCHSLMNPIGFAFAHFDEVGRWMDKEHGLPIDPSASVPVTEVAGDYADHVELLQAVAHSDTMYACVTTDWFRYAFGRNPVQGDECAMDRLTERFSASGGDVRELLLAMVTSSPFLYRTAFEPPNGGEKKAKE